MFCNFLGVCNSLFLSFFFFFMQTIFKVFIEFVTILLLFMVWFFGQETCGILSKLPNQGLNPHLLH